MDRKRKLRLIQVSLLLLGTIIIFFTYAKKEKPLEKELVPKAAQEKIKKQLAKKSEDGDVFFNISYSGLDLAGNRYILKAEEAKNSKKNQKVVFLKFVEATFYFKDDTILYVKADNGIYNNKTLDMKFEQNVKANYMNSELFAEKAEYSNSESFLSIYENVRINDIQGSLIADKLLFDITSQKLDITSFSNGKINANVNLK